MNKGRTQQRPDDHGEENVSYVDGRLKQHKMEHGKHVGSDAIVQENKDDKSVGVYSKNDNRDDYDIEKGDNGDASYDTYQQQGEGGGGGSYYYDNDQGEYLSQWGFYMKNIVLRTLYYAWTITILSLKMIIALIYILWGMMMVLTWLKWMPLLFILIGSGGIYFQANQEPIIDFTSTVAGIIDDTWNDWVARFIADISYCLSDVCDLYNSFTGLLMTLIRELVNILTDVLSKREVMIISSNDQDGKLVVLLANGSKIERQMTEDEIYVLNAPIGSGRKNVYGDTMYDYDDGSIPCPLDEKGNSILSKRCDPMVHEPACTICGYIHDAVDWVFTILDYWYWLLGQAITWLSDLITEGYSVAEAFFYMILNDLLDIPCFNDPIPNNMIVCVCGGSPTTGILDLIFDQCLHLDGLASSLLHCFSDIGSCVISIVGDITGGILGSIGLKKRSMYGRDMWENTELFPEVYTQKYKASNQNDDNGESKHYMYSRYNSSTGNMTNPNQTYYTVDMTLEERVGRIEDFLNAWVNSLLGTNGKIYFGPVINYTNSSSSKRMTPMDHQYNDGYMSIKEVEEFKKHSIKYISHGLNDASLALDNVAKRGVRPPWVIFPSIKQDDWHSLMKMIGLRKQSSKRQQQIESNITSSNGVFPTLMGVLKEGMNVYQIASSNTSSPNGIPNHEDIYRAVDASNIRNKLYDLAFSLRNSGSYIFQPSSSSSPNAKREMKSGDNSKTEKEIYTAFSTRDMNPGIILNTLRKLRSDTMLMSARLFVPHRIEQTKDILKNAGVPEEYVRESETYILKSDDSKRYAELGKALRMSIMEDEELNKIVSRSTTTITTLDIDGNDDDDTIHKRQAQFLAGGGLMGNVGSRLLKNPKLLFSAIIPFAVSRYGQVILGNYAKRFITAFESIFKEPLSETFSTSYLESFGSDLLDITINNAWFTADEGIRIGLCQMIKLFIKALSLIPMVGQIFDFIPNSILTWIGPCPPHALLDSDNFVKQKPWEYLNDIVQCDNSQSCTTSADCRGGAPCHCDNIFQYSSLAISLNLDHTCPGNTGKCLCWPSITCNAVPQTINWKQYLDGLKTCKQRFGYETKDIVYYFTLDFNTRFQNIMNNTKIGVTYMIRFVAHGIHLSPILFAIPFFISMMSLVKGFSLFLAMELINYLSPKLAVFINDTIVSICQNLVDHGFWPLTWLGNFVLELSRYPDYETNPPLGDPADYETACFLINIPSTMIGIGVYFMIGGAVIYFFNSSMFLFIIEFLYQTLLLVMMNVRDFVRAWLPPMDDIYDSVPGSSYIAHRYGGSIEERIKQSKVTQKKHMAVIIDEAQKMTIKIEKYTGRKFIEHVKLFLLVSLFIIYSIYKWIEGKIAMVIEGNENSGTSRRIGSRINQRRRMHKNDSSQKSSKPSSSPPPPKQPRYDESYVQAVYHVSSNRANIINRHHRVNNN